MGVNPCLSKRYKGENLEESVIYGFENTLKESKKPQFALAKFLYVSLNITDKVSTKDIGIFGRLIRLYGRVETFNGLLVVLGYPNLTVDNYPQLLNGMLIRMSKEKKQETVYEDLANTEYGKRILANYE